MKPFFLSAVQIALFTLIALILNGCSLFNHSQQIIAVNVTPANSQIIVNGLAYRGGTIYAAVARDKELLIDVRHDRYRPYKYVIPTELSSTGIIDACSGILIFPLLGLTSQGAWELSENVVNIDLIPMTEAEIQEAEATGRDNTAEAQKHE